MWVFRGLLWPTLIISPPPSLSFTLLLLMPQSTEDGFTLESKTKSTPKPSDPLSWEQNYWTHGASTRVRVQHMKNWSGTNGTPLACQNATNPTQNKNKNLLLVWETNSQDWIQPGIQKWSPLRSILNPAFLRPHPNVNPTLHVWTRSREVFGHSRSRS